MSASRALRWSPHAVPLSAALMLHALLLAAAARASLRTFSRADEDLGTIALALARPKPPPAPAAEPPRFAELETRVVEPLDADLVEPALFVQELPPLPVPEPPAPTRAEPGPQVALDLAPLELASLDFGGFGGAGPVSAGGSGAGGAPGAVAAVGSGGGPPGGSPAASGTGSGTTGTPGEAAAPARPRVRAPEPIEKPTPVYPKLSRRAGEEGSVVCRLHVSAEGLVVQVEVIESSGFTRLDEAAREMLARWRFTPKLVDGRAEATTWDHKVTFELEG